MGLNIYATTDVAEETARLFWESKAREVYGRTGWKVCVADDGAVCVVDLLRGQGVASHVDLAGFSFNILSVRDLFLTLARRLDNDKYAKLAGPVLDDQITDHVGKMAGKEGASRSGNIEFYIAPATAAPGLPFKVFAGDTWETRGESDRAVLVHKRTDIWLVGVGDLAAQICMCKSDEQCYDLFRYILSEAGSEQGQAILTSLTAVSYALGFAEATIRAEQVIGEQLRKLRGE